VDGCKILSFVEADRKRIFFIGRIENCEVWENFLRQVVQSVISESQEAKPASTSYFLTRVSKMEVRATLAASRRHYLTEKTRFP
jgi:hypothetical protein